MRGQEQAPYRCLFGKCVCDVESSGNSFCVFIVSHGNVFPKL